MANKKINKIKVTGSPYDIEDASALHPGDAKNFIDVGTTTTGTPGTNASVTKTVVGDVTKFNFTIPEGLKGDPGPAGSVASFNTSGTGNAVTGLTLNSDKSVTVTKDKTFLETSGGTMNGTLTIAAPSGYDGVELFTVEGGLFHLESGAGIYLGNDGNATLVSDWEGIKLLDYNNTRGIQTINGRTLQFLTQDSDWQTGYFNLPSDSEIPQASTPSTAHTIATREWINNQDYLSVRGGNLSGNLYMNEYAIDFNGSSIKQEINSSGQILSIKASSTSDTAKIDIPSDPGSRMTFDMPSYWNDTTSQMESGYYQLPSGDGSTSSSRHTLATQEWVSTHTSGESDSYTPTSGTKTISGNLKINNKFTIQDSTFGNLEINVPSSYSDATTLTHTGPGGLKIVDNADKITIQGLNVELTSGANAFKLNNWAVPELKWQDSGTGGYIKFADNGKTTLATAETVATQEWVTAHSSGGTKLYKHQILTNQSDFKRVLFIISTDANPYTASSIGQSNFLSGYVGYNRETGFMLTGYLTQTGPADFGFNYLGYTGMEGAFEIEIESDTVTEL